VSVTWATADSFSDRAGADWGALPAEEQSAQKGRFARAYFDNLRADLADARRAGVQPTLLDLDVPESTVSQLANLDPEALQEGVRYTLLSSVLPLFDEQVSFNRPGSLHIVRPDGHLQRTRFVPVAGGSPEELAREGELRIREARVERRRGELCIAAEGLGAALEWVPRRPLRGRDWWLRAGYSTDPDQPPSQLFNNPGDAWAWEGPKLPPMGSAGTAFAALSEAPDGVPTNAGVRVGVPPSGRLCLRSLEIGSFDPAAPSPQAGGVQ
jgi:hypothetical protein